MNTTTESMWRVADAVSYLSLPEPLGRTTLAKLGRDCTRLANIWQRHTGVQAVEGLPWPTEKTYTRDVLEEVFRLHPATRAAMLAQLAAKESRS